MNTNNVSLGGGGSVGMMAKRNKNNSYCKGMGEVERNMRSGYLEQDEYNSYQ